MPLFQLAVFDASQTICPETKVKGDTLQGGGSPVPEEAVQYAAAYTPRRSFEPSEDKAQEGRGADRQEGRE